MADRDDATVLVAQNMKFAFHFEVMMEQEGKFAGHGQIPNITQHNENNSSGSSGSTFSFHLEWKI